jgi:ribulose-5-phosphate 4-epimerase/fuculose-1-phosphate aldolase
MIRRTSVAEFPQPLQQRFLRRPAEVTLPFPVTPRATSANIIPMTPPDALLDTLLKAWRFLYRRGFIEGFGHLSARLPDPELFLLARHSLGQEAEADDFVTLDLKGRKVAGRGDPPAEMPIHLGIYQARPDIGSVVHYHGLYSTAFTTSEHRLRPIHLMGTLFSDGIPVYDDPRLVTDMSRGEALACALGSHRAVLLQAHGAAVTGGSVEDCVAGAFLFEENAQRAQLAASMGTPRWIDPATATAAGEELLRSRGPFRRVWSLVESEADDHR